MLLDTTTSLSVPNYQAPSMTKLSVWIKIIYVVNNMFNMIVVVQTTNDTLIYIFDIIRHPGQHLSQEVGIVQNVSVNRCVDI